MKCGIKMRLYYLIIIFQMDLSTIPYSMYNSVDCEWGDWTAWGKCKGSCDPSGTRTKTRTVKKPAKYGGKCLGDRKMTEQCNCPGWY